MPEYQQVTGDLTKTPKKYYIMYTHARYYIIILRGCTKVIKVCNAVTQVKKKREGRKERGEGATLHAVKKCI